MAFGPFSFGPSPFGGPTDADLARALAQMQAGMPTGFSGAPSVGMPQGAAPMSVQPQGLGAMPPPLAAMAQGSPMAGDPRMVPLPPMRPGADDLVVSAQPSYRPVSAGAPPGARPAPNPTPNRPAPGDPRADAPAAGAQPIMAQGAGMPQGATVEPSGSGGFLSALGRPEVYNTLLGIGQGLLTQKGIGPALAAGAGYTQKLNATSAATRLAEQQAGLSRAKFGLEMQKAGREQQAANATAKMIADKTGVPYDQALGLVGNKEFVNAFLSRNINAPEGWQRTQDGGLTFVPGGPQDPATISAQAQARSVERDTQQLVDVPQPDGSTAKMWLRKGETEGQAVGAPKPGAPIVREFTGPDGSKVPHSFDPATRQWQPLDLGGTAPAQAGNPYATGKFNNEQGKAAGFSDRMLGSEQTLRELEGTNSGFWGGVAGSLSDYTPNAAKGADRQRFEQAKRDFVNAQLRRESGAAISQKEFDNAAAQYFPQPGDSVEVIAQKRRNRQLAVEAMGREGGPSYRPRTVFDESGAMVPYQPQQQKMPAQPSRSALEAEARRRGLIQ